MPETGDCQQYDGIELVITRSRVSMPSLLHSVHLQKLVKGSENQAKLQTPSRAQSVSLAKASL